MDDLLLERLLRFYEAYFDIYRDFTVGNDQYDAYASCNVCNTKYVLVKSAQLWKTNSYEHVFFRKMDELSLEELQQWQQQKLREHIEPEFVRKGQKCPPVDHMCTYLTTVFICRKALEKEKIRQIRRHKFHKNYRFALRGYCESRLAVFDLESGKIYGNGPAKPLLKQYKQFL